ncbi:hypothetical protein K435DRAFT_558774, partial [Dendrothele bispora CBS 962.96]
LREFELSTTQWDIARQLVKVLKFFSRDDSPNLATVIPAMDKIDEDFSNFIIDEKLNPAIRAAVSISKKTLNRYYDKTDHSEVYRIAMILHPRHKLSYFKRMGWDKEWIEKAEEICRDEYE